MTVAEIGIRSMLKTLGTAKPVMRRNESPYSAAVQRRQARKRCFLYNRRSSQSIEMAWEITVARAAPRIPMAGQPRKPKIMIGSRTRLTRVPTIISQLAALESPAEIRMPLPTIGRVMVGAPMNQVRM
ncbi:MAG: hypothetical protein BWY83_02597 [bacterium ADurb.Bin478]|nr:MAG: hypothetical protein BWY83_02597 [bacterium ADurb.Bin478]